MTTIESAATTIRAPGFEVEVDEAQLAAVSFLAVPSKGIDTWWDGLDSSLRREVVAALVATVTVHRVGIGRRRFDTSAITVIWR
jgi:hypothetical protein